MPKQKLPTSGEIASHLNLEEFRSGLHTIRKYPVHGEPSGHLLVRYCWQVIVTPHVGDHLMLCGAIAEPEEHYSIPENTLKGWKKFVLATFKDSAVLPFKEDPVAEELLKFNLLPYGNRGLVVDGISYEITVSTPEMQGRISFSNPADLSTVRFVGKLLGVARLVAQCGRGSSLRDSVLSWEKFL